MTITKLMPLAEMQARWCVTTLWTGRGLQVCPDCGEQYPVLYMNAEHCKEGRCRACFVKRMVEATK